MSTKKLQILGTLGNKVYVQNEAPLDAPDGSVWIDLDDGQESDTSVLTNVGEGG